MKLSLPQISQPATLADLAHDTLKQFLLSPKAKGLERLEERTLAKQLGISRTPLREAVNRLIFEGFLRVEPRRGVFLNHPSKKEIIEILHVRAALESMAARLTASRITSSDLENLRKIFAPFHLDSVEEHVEEFSLAHFDFHEQVLELSGCGKLIEMASNIRDQMRLVRVHTMRIRRNIKKSLIEHLEIIDALESRDPDVAANRMREHILNLVKYVENSTESYPWNQQSSS